MVMRYRRTPLGVLVNIFEGLGDFWYWPPSAQFVREKKKNRNNFFLKIAAVQEKIIYIRKKNKEPIYEVSEELAK